MQTSATTRALSLAYTEIMVEQPRKLGEVLGGARQDSGEAWRDTTDGQDLRPPVRPSGALPWS